MLLPAEPKRIVDVGGGYGRQAILLARAGHSVVIVDCDERMLSAAQAHLSAEQVEVQKRVELVLAGGENAVSTVGCDFDLACCHSVLKYLEDPREMLGNLVRLVRHDGLVSVLSINTNSRAMRSGLQGRWGQAIASLVAGSQVDDQYLPCYEHSREDIAAELEAAGARQLFWQGVGIFTDHLTEDVTADDPRHVFLAEWLAGSHDPYRQIARCYHLLAERTRVS